MQELASVGLMPENWGGDVPVVQVFIQNGMHFYLEAMFYAFW